MLKILGIVGILVIAFFVIVVVIASTKPSTFLVQRSVVIAAPPEKILPLVNDFHNWTTWSPWEHLDPAMQKTYSGAASGTGAIYEWSGNTKAGAGRMEIVSATPAQTDIKLDFIKPFPNSVMSSFAYAPDAGGTRVTWSMTGQQKLFPSKVMSVFVTMDKMIGGDFQDGLANLKAAAEK